MEAERGLALCDLSLDTVPEFLGENWSFLPPELLEMIGSKISEGAHLHNAALVCKSWNASIATGLTSMEVDMHSDPAMWRAKVEKLQSLIRHLQRCVIHVNTNISDAMLFQNIALVQQLKGVSELKLHMRDGCDLPSAAAAAIGAMHQLTSLSIVGGCLTRDAAAKLLTGLATGAAAAAASGVTAGSSSSSQLRSLTLLPAVQHGLGDEEMSLLAACSSLEALEFRAHRLTSAGLATLSLGLPRLARLAITSLDSDSGYELACLERLSALAELDLALDQAPTGAASRRALCAVRPGRSLSLSFRWTERAQGLLAEYGNRLSNLTHLDVGACRVGSESLFEAMAQLTGLRELRMAVYSNADHCIPCHLSRLSALAALQRFHLEKRRAYFPEARRFGESSIAVPVTAEGLRSLAGRWCRLRSLRLALSRKDYSPEALSVLASFTGLRELGIVVERYPGSQQAAQQQQQQQAQQQQQQQLNPHSGSGASGSGHGTQPALDTSQGEGEGVQQQDPPAGTSGGGVGGSLGRLSRRSVDLPPSLDLACLPPGLHSLELNNLLLDLSEPLSPSMAGLGLGPGRCSVPFAPTSSMDAAYTAMDDDNLNAGAASPFQDATTLKGGAVPAPPAPPPALSLSQLASMDVEACVVRPPLLAQLALRCGPSLRSLRLVGVVGLSDGALADSLPGLPMLRALTVSAPGNRAVSQAGLAALSSCRRPPLLRQLMWESDDLTARGPALHALAPLTSLRHLYLSCTDKTAELALGSLRVLQVALPYCHVDMVWTAARAEAQ